MNNLDSLFNVIDSLRHSQVVINNITPEKSFSEIYAPYIASGITAFVTLLVLIFTLRSNRKRIKEDNLIKLRKEWLNDFVLFCRSVHSILFQLQDIDIADVKGHRAITEQSWKLKALNLVVSLEEKITEAEMIITLEGAELKELTQILSDYRKSFTDLQRKKFTDDEHKEAIKLEKNEHFNRFYVCYKKIVIEQREIIKLK